MFTIDSNQTIKISRGDDSGEFSLFVNKGTAIDPIRHEFSYKISYECPEYISVKIDKNIWEKNPAVLQKGTGTYSFYYKESNNTWYLDNGIISLADFGIDIGQSQAKNEDTIVVLYHNFVEEVYFYVFEHNRCCDDFLFKKTFTTEGKIITDSHFGSSRMEKNQEVIDENKDILLKIDSLDTKCLESGDYVYVIKAKLYNVEKEKYYINTITDSHSFYVIDDDFNRCW